MWYLIVSIPDLCTLTYFYELTKSACWGVSAPAVSSTERLKTRYRNMQNQCKVIHCSSLSSTDMVYELATSVFRSYSPAVSSNERLETIYMN